MNLIRMLFILVIVFNSAYGGSTVKIKQVDYTINSMTYKQSTSGGSIVGGPMGISSYSPDEEKNSPQKSTTVPSDTKVYINKVILENGKVLNNFANNLSVTLAPAYNDLPTNQKAIIYNFNKINVNNTNAEKVLNSMNIKDYFTVDNGDETTYISFMDLKYNDFHITSDDYIVYHERYGNNDFKVQALNENGTPVGDIVVFTQTNGNPDGWDPAFRIGGPVGQYQHPWLGAIPASKFNVPEGKIYGLRIWSKGADLKFYAMGTESFSANTTLGMLLTRGDNNNNDKTNVYAFDVDTKSDTISNFHLVKKLNQKFRSLVYKDGKYITAGMDGTIYSLNPTTGNPTTDNTYGKIDKHGIMALDFDQNNNMIYEIWHSKSNKMKKLYKYNKASNSSSVIKRFSKELDYAIAYWSEAKYTSSFSSGGIKNIINGNINNVNSSSEEYCVYGGEKVTDNKAYFINSQSANLAIYASVNTNWKKFYDYGHGANGNTGGLKGEAIAIASSNSNNPEKYDFGDAPTDYPHVSHKISSDLYLGNSAPDAEDNQQSSANASGDGADDNDGVQSLPPLTVGDTSYTVPVKVFNHTGQNAKITAWIDFDGNGIFEEREALNTNDLTVPSSSSPQTVDITWDKTTSTDYIKNAKAGKTFMRIRLSTSRVLRCAAEHYADESDLNYGGNYFVSPDGEVEDYKITIKENSSSSSSATCYALTDDSDRLYKVSMQPGANPLPEASYISIDQEFNGEGSAYRASNNKFYAFTGVSDDEGPSDLYSIDVETGVVSPVKNNIINGTQGTVEGAEFYFNPTLNKEILYVISQEDNSKLYAFDPDNNWALLAGYPKNTHTDLSSLAINPVNGIAYAIDDYNYNDEDDYEEQKPKVYQLNLATGTTTHITTLEYIADAEGLAFASDGNLYIEDEGWEDDLDGHKLYMVNLQTGELTPAAITNSDGDIEGLSCNGTQIALDNPTIKLDNNNSITEGNSGTRDLAFSINLDKPASKDILVQYEITDINTTANEDYILDSNLTILIPKDATSSSIIVKIKGDVNVEDDESFSLKLVDASNAVIDNNIVIGTIINDDALATEPFTCTNEGHIFNSNYITDQFTKGVTIDLENGTIGDPTQFATRHVNAAGYNVKDNFIYGIGFKSDTDNLAELVKIDKDYKVQSFPIAGLPQTYDNGGVEANLLYAYGDVSFDNKLYFTELGKLEKLRVIDLTTKKLLSSITLKYPETNSTKINSADYAFNPVDKMLYVVNATNHQLTKINPNSGVVTELGDVGLAGENLYSVISFFDLKGNYYFNNAEAKRMFKINISNPDDVNATATPYLNDLNLSKSGDGAKCAYSYISELSITDSSVTEGDTGTVDLEFTITLDENSTAPITFNYQLFDGNSTATEENAESPSDYVNDHSLHSVTIPANTNKYTLSIPVKGDKEVEQHEKFTILISDIQGALDNNITAVGTIINDDVNPDLDQDDDGILDSIEYGTCPTGVQTLMSFDDFGVGGRTTTPYTTYCYEDGTGGDGSCQVAKGITYWKDNTNTNDGEYAIVQHPKPDAASFSAWSTQGDHTGNSNGRMMVVNASEDEDEFYRRSYTVVPNAGMTVDLWILNVVKNGSNLKRKPNISFSLENMSGEQIGEMINTGSIPENGIWNHYTLSLNPGDNSEIQIVLANNEKGGSGNDLALDDIRVRQTFCDHDNDGIADFLDLDSDNDGIPDNIEAQSTQDYIKPNKVFTDDGVDTAYANLANGGLTPVDTDADGTADYLDLDSDNDGIFDIEESGLGNNDKSNDGRTDAHVGKNGLDNSPTHEHDDGLDDVNGMAYENNVFRLKDTDGDMQPNGSTAAPMSVDFDYRDNDYKQDPFTCTEALYLSNRTKLGTGDVDSGATWLHNFNAVDATYTPIGEGFDSIEGGYNAIGYNVKDDYIYALYSNHLLKVDTNAIVKDLGEVEGLTTKQLYAGEFDRDGFYYVTGTGGDDNKMYKIDIEKNKVIKTITLSKSVKFWDMAIDTSGEYFYTMLIQDNNDNSNFENNKFAKIKISDGTITTVGDSHSDLPSYISLIFADASDKIVALANDGKLYEIMPLSGKTYFTKAFADLTFYNDGTSCPDANITLPPHPPRLSINNVSKKEEDSGETIFDFTVTADQPFSSSIMSGIGGMALQYRVIDGNGDEITPPHEAALSSDHDFKTEEDYAVTASMFSTDASGGTTIHIPVTVYGDIKIEKDEEFYVEIYAPKLPPFMNPKYVVDRNIGIGTIINDDAPRFHIERARQDSTVATNQAEQDAKESFYTQIAGRDFDYSIVSYDKNSSSFDEFNVEDMTMKVEVIDKNSTVNNDVVYSFYTYIGENGSRFDILNQDINKLELNATRDAQFKVSYLLDENGTLVHGEFTDEQEYTEKKNTNNQENHGYSDHFAIRPASYRIELNDLDENNNSVTYAKNNVPTQNLSLVAEYPYTFKAYAVLDENKSIAKDYRTLNPKELNVTLDFDERGTTVCADTNTTNVDRNNNYNFMNGQLSEVFSHNNVGRYTLHIEDINWTNIDKELNNPGCIVGSSSNIADNTGKFGCNIASNEGNNFFDVNMTFQAYEFSLRDTNIVNSFGKNYMYMNNLGTNARMGIDIFTNIYAQGFDHNILTNFTNNCVAENVRVMLHTDFADDDNLSRYGIQSFNDNNIAADNIQVDSPTNTLTIPRDQFLDINEGNSSVRVRYNIGKDYNEATNPVNVQFQNFDANSTYFENSKPTVSQINARRGLNNTSIINGQNQIFYYTRVSSLLENYPSTNKRSIRTPLFVEVYCRTNDINQSWCRDTMQLTANGMNRNGAKTYKGWYLATAHTAPAEGSITALVSNNPNQITTDYVNAANNVQNGTIGNINTVYVPAGQLNAKTTAVIRIDKDDWLIYNPYPAYSVTMTPVGGMTGIDANTNGELGYNLMRDRNGSLNGMIERNGKMSW